MNVDSIIHLSETLAQLADVKRATKLPNGENESDSHHSFSLALIAYDICSKHCPELDTQKVLLFALAHDLLEVVTGDEDTLHYDAAQLKAKHEREQTALGEFDKLFEQYPALRGALYEYEKLDTPEAATVFVLDKACTTWTHFHDKGHHARTVRNIQTRKDAQGWGDRQRAKMIVRLKVQPPQVIMDIYESSFRRLQELLDE